jgi:hypothetical protein
VAIGWTVLGIIAFLIWARTEHVWPFGPKEIKEEFLATAGGAATAGAAGRGAAGGGAGPAGAQPDPEARPS